MQFHVERLASVTSTMDAARERARAGAPDGTVVVAQEMTAGRGSKGRPWHAPKGGLYLSIILRDVSDPRLLTLALGNAVAEALEVAGVDPRLKWVNDVLVEDRKIAGILVESEATGDRFDFLVAGIGFNVNGRAVDIPGLADAITLEDALHCDSCIPDLETFLLEAVGRWVQKVREGQVALVVEAFRARDALRGKPVVVEDGRAAPVAGTAEGIADDGRLLVRTGGGVRAFASGTVRPAAAAETN